MRLFKLFISSLLFLIILPVCFAAFLLITTPGLRISIMLLNWVLPGNLQVVNVKGRLIDRFSIDHITYTSEALIMDIDDLAIAWKLNNLIQKKLTISQLQMLKLQVKIRNNVKAISNTTTETALWRSPLILDLKEATINLAQIIQGNTVHQLTSIRLHANMDEHNWQINPLNFNFSHTSFSALANGSFTKPYSIRAHVQFKPIGLFKQQLEGILTLGGDETFYHWQGTLSKPLNLQLNGSLDKNKTLYTFAQWQELVWKFDANNHLASRKGSLRMEGQLPEMAIHLSAELQKPFQGEFDSDAQTTKQGITATTTIKLPQGSASINLRGTDLYSKKYQWEASLALPDLTLFHPDLKNLKTAITAKANASGWSAQGSIIADGKMLSLVGKGNSLPRVTGSVTMEGTDVPLINLPEYKISFSPQLILQFTPEGITLRGNVLIPNAKITPENFTSSQSLTDDATFVGEDSETKSLPIDSDITVTMGDNVALAVKGISGFLTGSIRLRQIPPGPLNATGELTIREGKYHAYGQNLAIEQGQLLFTGGLIVNPGIHVRATRQFKNSGPNPATNMSSTNQLFDFNTINVQNLETLKETTVGIEVTGRLKAPTVKLFSTPATLSQADILSMLILGRPANQASHSGAQLLLTAISALNLDSGTSGAQLLSQLKQRLGFDIDFQTNTQYNRLTNQVSENRAIVVKKALSKRLFLSYNFGLTQADVNVLTLTYLLNKFFSIQVNASDNNSSLDILYNHNQE